MDQPLYLIVVFLLGLAAGSFINAWVYRLHKKLPIARGRSQCPHCKQKLVARDLIPVLSYLALRGKCRYCSKNISWQYPAVELATAILFVLAAITMPDGLMWHWYTIVVLITLFVYDARYMLLPDRVTLPALAVLTLVHIVTALNTDGGENLLEQLFLPILVGGGFFALQFIVSKGRWIGGGDIRLGALMGVILGWPGILTGLMVAYVIGAVVSIALIATKKKTMQSAVPFGTFLAVATVITMFWTEQVLQSLHALANIFA